MTQRALEYPQIVTTLGYTYTTQLLMISVAISENGCNMLDKYQQNKANFMKMQYEVLYFPVFFGLFELVA